MSSFRDLERDPTAESFLKDGYVVVEAESRSGLDRIRDHVAGAAAEHLGVSAADGSGPFLDRIHRHVDPGRLNGLRLAAINSLKAAPWFRPAYYALARTTLHSIVGNELAMQRGVGLSVQLPDDDSSLLPIHSDVWDGDSPFEIVLWVPLVDCYRSKSMYIVPLAQDRFHQSRVATHRGGAEALFQAVKGDVRFLDIRYGQVLLFSQTLMHGNRVNEEPETRWSMNCRFKSAMSPYADKRLGEFFELISLRPATRLALSYEMPGGFDE